MKLSNIACLQWEIAQKLKAFHKSICNVNRCWVNYVRDPFLFRIRKKYTRNHIIFLKFPNLSRVSYLEEKLKKQTEIIAEVHSQALWKIKITFALAFLTKLRNLHINSKSEILYQFLYQPSKHSLQVLIPKSQYFSII